MENRAKAKQLLLHYFTLLAQRAGIPWNADNMTEVEMIVDYIVDACKEEIAK